MTQFIKPFLYENSLAYFVSKKFFLKEKSISKKKIGFITLQTNMSHLILMILMIIRFAKP